MLLRLFVFCVLSLSLLLNPIWTQAVDDNGIFDLTELDFQKTIEEKSHLLVNFHALWCRYSKKLKPEWVKLIEPMKALNVNLARVEAYDEKKLAELYDVEGYPTIKLFINQKPHTYTGERNAEAITEWVSRLLKQPLKSVSSVDDVTNYLKEYEWVGILAGSGSQDAVKDVAFDDQDVLFLTTTDSSVESKYNVKDGQFVLINNVSQGSDVLTDAITADSLKKFIDSKKFPSIARFSKGTAERIFLSDEPSLVLLRGSGSGDDAAEQALKDASSTLSGKIFLSVATDDDIGKLLATNLGVESLPAVVIVRADRERIRKYLLQGSITSDSIKNFYTDYTQKKATRLYLSEPAPENDVDLVKKVVTKNFQKLVLDSTKDVLLQIWAPWCGHCRAMMPVYDNVARKTREMPDFLVAKVDASVNDLEGFGLDIVEYPTILLFRKDDKENPVEFKDERNEYKFVDFIRANAHVSVEKLKNGNPFDRNEL